MTIVDYIIDDHVAILRLNYGENKFDSDFITVLIQNLKDILNNTDSRTLVVVSSHKKIFSNGINLEWLIQLIKSGDIEKVKNFFYLLNTLFKLILVYPLVTIAAINGHAFAGGAIFSCAFDIRIMRSDRGFFCLPEVNLGIPFLPGMNEILKKAIPNYVLNYLQLTGVRLDAFKCKEHNIILDLYDNDKILKESVNFAKTIKKERNIVEEIKKRLYYNIFEVLDKEDTKFIESTMFNIFD